jgi:hypothetical protein
MDQPPSQFLSVDLEQNDCLQIINILGTYNKTKGKAWDSWAGQINKIMQSGLDQSPARPKVKITLDFQNWISIDKI